MLQLQLTAAQQAADTDRDLREASAALQDRVAFASAQVSAFTAVLPLYDMCMVEHTCDLKLPHINRKRGWKWRIAGEDGDSVIGAWF